MSNNYPDKKWRIVDDARRSGLGVPGDVTFPSRDAAARAELVIARARYSPVQWAERQGGGPEMILTPSFEQAKARSVYLNMRVDQASAALKVLKTSTPRGPWASPPDHVRKMPEFQALRNSYGEAFEALRTFNGPYVKTFAKELKADRAQKRMQGGIVVDAPPVPTPSNASLRNPEIPKDESGADVLAAQFHSMRGHVAHGVRVRFESGEILTVKSAMVGWRLVSDDGGTSLGPFDGAHSLTVAIVQRDALTPSRIDEPSPGP